MALSHQPKPRAIWVRQAFVVPKESGRAIDSAKKGKVLFD
jgi:hypothetical protein